MRELESSLKVESEAAEDLKRQLREVGCLLRVTQVTFSLTATKTNTTMRGTLIIPWSNKLAG